MRYPSLVLLLVGLMLLVGIAGCRSAPAETAVPAVAESAAIETAGSEVATSSEVTAVPATANIPEATLEAAPEIVETHASRWAVIGRSGQGRAIEATHLGNGNFRVYLIGGIHGDETEGLGCLDGLLEALAAGPVPSVANVRVVRDINPDGTAARTRGNINHTDLNRNWPATNFRGSPGNGPSPLSEPETAAVHRDLLAFGPRLVIVFHSCRETPFVNFDGPAQGLAEAFVTAARASDKRWRVKASMGYPTPGSLGSLVGLDLSTPILTIEFQRGQETGDVLKAAMAGVEAAVLRAVGGV